MDIYLNGRVGEEITLDSVIAKFKGNEVENVYINSVGGDVWEGLAIYRYLKKQNINTITNGVVASIASVFFLAGKKRIANQLDDFLIHLPFSMGMGTASDLQKSADELKKVENKLAKIYEAETNLTFEQALEEMAKDEFTTPDWLKENGFIDEIREFKAVAIINNKQMKTGLTKEDKNWIQNAINSVKEVFSPKSKIVQDANGDDIDFYELESDATPQAGDKARIDGKDADGDVLLPSGETYVFTNGELTEIKPKEEENELNEKVEALEADVLAKKQTIADIQAKLDKAEKEKKEIETKLQTVSDKFDKFQNELKTKFNWDGTQQEQKNNKRKLFKD